MYRWLICAALVWTVISSSAVVASSRVALVIGNSDYEWSPLDNPTNDAKDMANTLRNLGFEVDVQTDARRVAMHRAIREFGKKLAGAEIGLFYYAGHGVQVGGRNYLVPTDADIREEDEVAFETIDAAQILEKMESANNPVNIVVLDACRNNPFASNSRMLSRGLARMDSPVGSLLLYATAPNKTAADGAGRNGVLTGNLIKHLNEPGLPLNEVILRTRVGVMSETADQQVPWSASSLTRNVVLNQLASLDNTGISLVEKSTTAISSSKAERLMKVCNKHYQANRLTSGAGGSALACYQQVLESDPYNIGALEGIENIADKYYQRASSSLEVERYASAERHLHSLKKINPEHPGIDDIEYALKVALFAKAAPAKQKTKPKAETIEQLQISEEIVNVVALEATEEGVQPIDIATVAAATNPETPAGQPAPDTTAIALSSSAENPASTIPGLTVHTKPETAVTRASTVNPEPIETSTNQTASIIKFVEKPAVDDKTEATQSPETVHSDEVKLALAQPVNGQPYQLCPGCMQPASDRGAPCIQHEVLKGAFTPSDDNACHTKIAGKCMDVQYKFRLSNICEADMQVEWVFSTFSGGTLVGKKKIGSGQTTEVTCLNKQQDCKGQIRYGWDSAIR